MHSVPRVIAVVAILAIVLSGGVLLAQPPVLSPKIDTVRSPDTAAFQMTKSPLEAVLLSAVIPGLGQIYLDQTWKAPIIWGIAGGFLYGALIQNFRYHYTGDTVNNAFARHNYKDSLWALQNVSNREFYRDDRDKWWIYLGLSYIATLLDAYIAANLYDFDVSDPRPTIGSYYDPIDRQGGVLLQIRF